MTEQNLPARVGLCPLAASNALARLRRMVKDNLSFSAIKQVLN